MTAPRVKELIDQCAPFSATPPRGRGKAEDRAADAGVKANRLQRVKAKSARECGRFGA